MATSPNSRNDSASIRSTNRPSIRLRPDLVADAVRWIEQNARKPSTSNVDQPVISHATQAAKATSQPPTTRTILPRHMYVVPTELEEYVNEDPVFKEAGAAIIVGVSPELLKKWRQRDKGPDYIQYEEGGPVVYPLSALKAYKAAHLVVTKKKGGKRK
jgi:hypothetical protein